MLSEFEYVYWVPGGNTSGWLVLHVRQQLGGRRRLRRRGRDRRSERVAARIVGEPAGVVEQLTQRDLAPGIGQVRQSFADRLVQRHDALVHERQDSRPIERLRHAGEAHMIIDARRGVRPHLGHARCVDRALRTTLHHDDRPRRTAWHRHQLLHRLIEHILAIRLIIAFELVAAARGHDRRYEGNDRNDLIRVPAHDPVSSSVE